MPRAEPSQDLLTETRAFVKDIFDRQPPEDRPTAEKQEWAAQQIARNLAETLRVLDRSKA